MELLSDDYRGRPVNIRQGRKFEEWPRISFTVIKPLTFLHGRTWNDLALAYVHGLRPSHLRVIDGGAQCDAQPWRVTVHLEKDGVTIREIEQEVCVGLPVGIQNATHLAREFRSQA